MNIRKIGLIKFVAGAAIFAAFAQASALQSLTGGGGLFSLLGPPICMVACVMGLYEIVTGSSFANLARAFARRKGRAKWGIAVVALMALFSLLRVLGGYLATPL